MDSLAWDCVQPGAGGKAVGKGRSEGMEKISSLSLLNRSFVNAVLAAMLNILTDKLEVQELDYRLSELFSFSLSVQRS